MERGSTPWNRQIRATPWSPLAVVHGAHCRTDGDALVSPEAGAEGPGRTHRWAEPVRRPRRDGKE